MDDLRGRFATLDAVPVPDVWTVVERRLEALGSMPPAGSVAGRQTGWRVAPGATVAGSANRFGGRRTIWLVAAAVIVVVLVGGALAVGSGLVRRSTVVSPSPNWSPIVSPPAQSLAAGSGSWIVTEPMLETRFGETATLLPNGRILVAGGRSDWGGHGIIRASAELFDPDTGRWALTGSMHQAREGRAVLLGSGQVLMVGGDGGTVAGRPNPILSGAELYDPGSGVWTNTGNMTTGLSGATATLLEDGRVLVAGGLSKQADGPVGTAEIYDPVSGRWSETGAMKVPRQGHTATLLPDGRVLVAGGGCCDQAARASAEVYDPATGRWIRTGSLAAARVYHTAILLRNGKVLVFGGDNRSDHPPVTTAELYDPATGAWTTTGSPRNPGNLFEAMGAGSGPAVRLPDGRVLAAASDWAPALAIELYDPAAGSWSDAPGLGGDHYAYVHTVTLLPDGRAVVTYDDATAIFDPNGRS